MNVLSKEKGLMVIGSSLLKRPTKIQLNNYRFSE